MQINSKDENFLFIQQSDNRGRDLEWNLLKCHLQTQNNYMHYTVAKQAA